MHMFCVRALYYEVDKRNVKMLDWNCTQRKTAFDTNRDWENKC